MTVRWRTRVAALAHDDEARPPAIQVGQDDAVVTPLTQGAWVLWLLGYPGAHRG